MTVDLSKCKHCKVWKETRGRGSKACLKCNPFREVLENLRPLDVVPDDVIEQYPDLQSGKIKSALDAIAKLPPIQFIVFCQRHLAGMSEKEMERFWRIRPYCVGYSDTALREIVKQALKTLQKIVKK
jgi:hypothetical protein